MDIQQIIFYMFSTILLFAAFMVVTTRHPVRGVMFLILAFFASSVLWLLLTAEFLAFVLVFVYVGAVMTLFLFVVMMLNVETLPDNKGMIRYLTAGILVAIILTTFMLQAVGSKHFNIESYPEPNLYAINHEEIQNNAGEKVSLPSKPYAYSNIKALGAVLYTEYMLPFELSAILLLVAIIAAINLTFRGRRQKTQRIYTQVTANKKDRLRIINLKAEKP